jgi:hypothetical protein
MDAWAHQPNFQPLISSAMARQMSLDRIMIGFNGTSYADPSDRAANPLLQDCGIGWLQKIRNEAAHRRITGTITSRDEDNAIVERHLRQTALRSMTPKTASWMNGTSVTLTTW